MADLRLTRAAQADIAEIEEFSFREFGAEMTATYLEELAETLQHILDHPRIGIARDDLRSGTRQLQYRSHRIFYRADDSAIVIQRVVHNRRLVRPEMLP